MNKKIGLIGWYNHANYGDERILYCLRKIFKDCSLFVVNGWDDARLKLEELNKCDYILIGGGGLIIGNSWKNTDIILNLKKPFGFIGVSIETERVDKKLNDFLDLIKTKSEFILVRDKASRERLGYHYKVIVGPDLTFLYPFNIVEEVKEDICGVNLRPWHYWQGNPYGYYFFVMKNFINKLSFVEKMYPFPKWDADKTIQIIEQNFKNVLPIPFYFENNIRNDVDILSQYFSNVSQKMDMDLYKNIRYLIGMRYHSIVFAIQCGIPFISLSYQPKNMSLCSDMDFNELSCSIYRIAELEGKIEYIKANYEKIKKEILWFREKSIKDITYILKSLLYLIK